MDGTTPDGREIDTGGGAYVEGPARVDRGGFLGRDQIIHGDHVLGDKITIGPIVQQVARQAPSLHQIRPPVGDFIGREAQLEALRQAMATGGAAISGVRGMGGIGKTELARRLAVELAPRYPDAQLEIDLRGSRETPLAPVEALAQVIRAFLPEQRLPVDEAALGGLYRSLLHDKQALILLDDARDEAQVAPLVPPRSCALLITSRQHFVLPGMAALALDEMAPADAAALLRRIAPRAGEWAEALAEQCGRLPLALRLAGSALAERPTLDPPRYLERLTEGQTRAGLVEASLALSEALLDEEERARWWLLAVFPETFDLLAAAAVWEMEEGAAGEVLDALVRHSLVEWQAEGARGRLHDLARVYALDLLEEGAREEAGWRHAAYYAQVLQAADELYLQGGEGVRRGLALFDRERRNVQAGQAWAAARVEEERGTRLCNDYAGAGVYCLELRLYPLEQIRWLEEGVCSARRLNDRWAESRHLGNLGNAYYALGQMVPAIEYYEQALTIAREVGDRRNEGAWLGNLGPAYRTLGQVEQAISCHEQALVVARQIHDRREEGIDLGNLGLAYAELGQLERAIIYYEQSLAIAHEIGDQQNEGSILGNLGDAYHSLGQVTRAIPYYEQALIASREIGDRRGMSNWLSHLGLAYRHLGEVTRAIDYQEQALGIVRETGEQQLEAQALGSLGNAYADLGQVEKAIAYHELALAITLETGNRRGQSSTLSCLGNAYQYLGQVEEAIKYHEQALTIDQQIGYRRGEGIRFGSLGNCYRVLGQMERAIGCYEQALAIDREIGDQREEARHSWNLGLCYEQTDLVRAIELMSVYVAYEREIGHPDAEQHAARIEQIRARLGRPRRRWPFGRGRG